MDQRNEPSCRTSSPIVAGTIVDFPNNDQHLPQRLLALEGEAFNLGRYAAGQSKAVRFDEPGIVRVFCEIHSHMSAFILVFAHRYFAVTDDEGRYRLDNVPPGTYTVAVWNERCAASRRGGRSRSPEAGGDVDADFTRPMRPSPRSPTASSSRPRFLAVLSIGVADLRS